MSESKLVLDYMTKSVVSCLPSATLLDVRELLTNNRISRVVVANDQRKPLGVISEKDIINFLLSDQSKRPLDDIMVHEAASSNLYTIEPDARVEEAAQTMILKKISSLVVESDELEGIITKADVVNYMAIKGSDCSTEEFMTPIPVTVAPTQSIFDAIALLLQRALSRVIVVDSDKKPVGIITLADISLASDLTNLSTLYAAGPELAAKLLSRCCVMRRITAADFMTKQPHCVPVNSKLSEAAKLMVEHRISGVPVVDNLGALKGIISKTDIAESVAQRKAHQANSNSEIAEDLTPEIS